VKQLLCRICEQIKIHGIFGLIFKLMGCIISLANTIAVRTLLKECGANLRVLGPVYISGGKNISFGRDCFIGRNVVLDASNGVLNIGDKVEIRDGARIYARDVRVASGATFAESTICIGSVKIGRNVWIARGCDLAGVEIDENAILGPYVAIVPGDHDRNYDGSVKMSGSSSYRPIFIESGAWIGAHAIILKGVTVQKNAIVGAGAVVTKSVDPGIVVAGNPAKPIQSNLTISDPNHEQK